MTVDQVQSFLVLALATPVVLLGALAVPDFRRVALALAPWAPLPALLAALVVPPGETAHLAYLLLGTDLGLDGTGRGLLLVTALLWLLGGLHARRALQGQPRALRFHGYFLAAMTGNLGLVLALDAPSFYLFYALMSIAAYGLVVHGGDPEARRAGRIYIAFAMVAEVMVLSALVGLVTAAGSPALPLAYGEAPAGWLVLLLLAGFGVKAGLPALHMSLPVTYAVLSPAAGVVMAGAMLHAGLLGWMRFLPPAELAPAGAGAGLVVAGLAAAFLGVVAGLVQRAPRALLAYSSISQMGWMTVILGTGLAVPGAWPLALSLATLYALHHALAKGALFLGIDAPGAVRDPRLALAGLAVPALAVAGLPGTTGYLAKSGLKEAAGLLPPHWQPWLAILLPLGTLATTLLMARLLWLLREVRGSRGDLPSVVGWGVLIGASLTVPWAEAVRLAPGLGSPSLAGIGSALWPLALGAVLAGAVLWRGLPVLGRLAGRLPPGDVLWPLLVMLRAVARPLSVVSRDPPAVSPARVLGRLPGGAATERALGRWSVAAAAFLALILGSLLLLVLGA